MSFAYWISGLNRKRKWEIFLREMAPGAETTVLDVGFQEKEYSDTDNYIEKHYPYPANLTALGIDAPAGFSERYTAVRAVHYDGDIFPFQDGEFDICWSNAVIEHVGGREKQLLFLREIKRVARRAFFTTPNRFFPVEVHTRTPFLHYLPKKSFDTYLVRTGKEWAAGDYMRLLSLRELSFLLNEAGISGYRIITNRFLFCPLDYIVII